MESRRLESKLAGGVATGPARENTKPRRGERGGMFYRPSGALILLVTIPVAYATGFRSALRALPPSASENALNPFLPAILQKAIWPGVSGHQGFALLAGCGQRLGHYPQPIPWANTGPNKDDAVGIAPAKSGHAPGGWTSVLMGGTIRRAGFWVSNWKSVVEGVHVGTCEDWREAIEIENVWQRNHELRPWGRNPALVASGYQRRERSAISHRVCQSGETPRPPGWKP